MEEFLSFSGVSSDFMSNRMAFGLMLGLPTYFVAQKLGISRWWSFAILLIPGLIFAFLCYAALPSEKWTPPEGDTT